jgi:hypothetical protein
MFLWIFVKCISVGDDYPQNDYVYQYIALGRYGSGDFSKFSYDLVNISNETLLNEHETRIETLERRNAELEDRIANLTEIIEQLITICIRKTNIKGASLTHLKGLCSTIAL